ncbi:MAG: hypothetical protein H7222_07580 [Methylotenera sp.]|nr:hypothetical protein [Oligoflexia bacterium]
MTVTYRLGSEHGARDIVSRLPSVISAETENEAAPGLEKSPADSFSMAESHVRVKKDAKLRFPKERTLAKITRFRLRGSTAPDRVYSTERMGMNWTEDLVLGFGSTEPSNPAGSESVNLFKCSGRTSSRQSFNFYSVNANCGGPEPVGLKSALYVSKRLIDATFLPLFLCGTQEGVKYSSLNHLCEAKTDQVQELLGYVRANKIYVE